MQTPNKKLLGVLEWIVSKKGTITIFSHGVVLGQVLGLSYRYFISEGWISLRTPECPAGKGLECKTLKIFIDRVCANNSNI